MTQHLPTNLKWQLSTLVLEGQSFAKVAKQFNISKAGAYKIFSFMKFRIFPLISEREQIGIDMNDINSLRDAWKCVRMF